MFKHTLGTLKNIFKGGMGAKGRGGLAATYLGAGFGVSAYAEHVGEEKRNYYGEERYNSYYGNAAESISGAAKLAGMYYGLGAVMGRDPINRGLNTFRHLKAKGANRLNAAQNYMANRAANKRIGGKAADIRSREPHYWLSGDRNRSYKHRPRNKLSNITERARYVNEEALPGRMSSRSRKDPYSLEDIKKLKQTPRLGLRHLALYGSTALGAGWSSSMAENSASNLMGTAIGAGVVGAAGLTTFGLGYGAYKLGGKSMLQGSAVMGAAGAAGYMAAVRNNNPTAEGTITSFDKYNESGVSRMNFSTAGLVQALHNNNRRF